MTSRRHTAAMPALHVPAVLRRALATALFNAAIALFTTAISGESLAINMLYSQAIGLCIWAGIDGGRFLLDPSGWPGAWRMTALVVAAVCPGGAGQQSQPLARRVGFAALYLADRDHGVRRTFAWVMAAAPNAPVQGLAGQALGLLVLSRASGGTVSNPLARLDRASLFAAFLLNAGFLPYLASVT